MLYHPFAILDSHSARFTATSLWLTPATPPFLHPPSRTTPPFLHHPHAKVVCPCTLVSCSFCWPVRPVCDNPRFLRLFCFCLTSPLCPSFVTRPVSGQSLHFMCVLFFFCTVFLPRRETQHLPISQPSPTVFLPKTGWQYILHDNVFQPREVQNKNNRIGAGFSFHFQWAFFLFQI